MLLALNWVIFERNFAEQQFEIPINFINDQLCTENLSIIEELEFWTNFDLPRCKTQQHLI